MKKSIPNPLVAALALLGLASLAHADVVIFPPSSVYQVTLSKFYNAEDDLLVTVFTRDGKPVHGYAVTSARPEVIHRLDLTPAAPIEYLENGKRFTPAENLKGSYDYKKTDFRELRDRYNNKKIEMRNYDPPPALSVTDQRITGTLDLFLDTPDRKKRSSFRIAFNMPANEKGYTGTYTAYDYRAQDETFSVNTERFEGVATAQLDKSARQHSPDRAFAAGKDWPQTHGPTLTGSATDCDRPLIDTLIDARLQWVADLPIPGGRQGIPRSEFGFFPINNSGLGITQFSAPIIVDGKVYLSLPYPDEQALAAAPGVATHPQVIRGADPRVLASDLGLLRDTLFCIDAQSGQTLWAFRDERKSGLVGESKSGRGLTAAHIDGKIIFRGQSSLYAVDAATGKLLWHNTGVSNGKGHPDNFNFGPSRGLSTDDSPVIIGGVIVARINDTPKPAKGQSTDLAFGTTLVALDPATGKLLWRAKNVSGEVALPAQIILAGNPYVLAAYQGAEQTAVDPAADVKPEHRGMVTLIEPKTGKIVWQKPVAGPTRGYPLVWNDIALLNINRDQLGKDSKQKAIVARFPGALRLSLDNALPLWSLPKLDWQDGRQVPIAHHGVFFIDSRISGFHALKADTGEILGKFPHLYHMARGDHNWTWAIASNNRIFTSGEQMLLFKLENNQVSLAPGSLPADLAGGYVCPIRPALADGRLVVRTSNGISCFDVRKPAAQTSVDSIQLRTADLALGMQPGAASADLQIRLVNGTPQTIALRYPAFQNISTPRPFPWGGVDSVRWRIVNASALKTQNNRTLGTIWMNINEHVEPWTLDLTRSENSFTGTCTRSIPAVPLPVKLEGKIDGEALPLPENKNRYALRLINGGLNGQQQPTDLQLFIDRLPDGTLLACAASGRISQASFEVDASSLKIDGNRLHGPLTIIFHSDRFQHLRPDLASALASTYTIDLTTSPADAGKSAVAGNFTAQVGTAYERKVAITGTFKPATDIRVDLDPKAALPEVPAPDEDQ